jgi:hypothetical protein
MNLISWRGSVRRALQYGIWHTTLHCNISGKMFHMHFLHTERSPFAAEGRFSAPVC